MKLDTALRVYVDPGAQYVRVATDMRLSPSERHCFHLEYSADELVWVEHREGDYVIPILLDSFTAWLEEGGLEDVAPALPEQ
jgi:hypothetical protein